MSDKFNSFEKINYFLRPNKQVERKIIIDILQNCKNVIDLSKHCYVGMGSIYYFDFILMHRLFGIRNLFSVDNKDTLKRFEFNKPYEFIKFQNTSSSDYLLNHDWEKLSSIIWLDYDGIFYGNDYIESDIKIIGKNSNENDIFFLSINAIAPKEDKREKFLEKYKKYISPKFQDIQFVSPKQFPYLLQNILLNLVKESCEYNDNKFYKLFSFTYKDGAPMYTLGGIFTNKGELTKKILKLHSSVSLDEEIIHDIAIPNITYKEKFYLDSKLNSIKKWLNYYRKKVDKLNLANEKEKTKKLKELLSKRMDFELSPEELDNYLLNYKYIPQYYEGII